MAVLSKEVAVNPIMSLLNSLLGTRNKKIGVFVALLVAYFLY